MINKTFAIAKEKLDNMSSSEKVRYFDRMTEDLEDVEMVTFLVSGFSEKDLCIEEVALNLIEE